MAPFMGMLVSDLEGDVPRIPNHFCMGKGCLVCIAGGRTVTARQTLLHKCSTTPRRCPPGSDFHAEPAIPPFHRGCHELPNSSIVDETPMLNGSEPEPPHKCRVIPCKYCGRTWY